MQMVTGGFESIDILVRSEVVSTQQLPKSTWKLLLGLCFPFCSLHEESLLSIFIKPRSSSPIYKQNDGNIVGTFQGTTDF